MKHLLRNGYTWCACRSKDGQRPPVGFDSTSDPRKAECANCLLSAAEYGAAAAMRYAAVEAGATQDPELARERDAAIARVRAIGDALEQQNAFFCNDCMRLRSTTARGLTAGGASWCTDCAPHGVRA